PGAYSTDPEAGAFVTKMNPAGAIIFSTYFTTVFGPADARAFSIDAAGNAYVTGSVMVPGSNTGLDVFVTKMNPTGSGIVYTQTIRASKDEIGKSIAVGAGGSVYLTGGTSSINFPTSQTAAQALFGGGPAFRTTSAGASWAPS